MEHEMHGGGGEEEFDLHALECLGKILDRRAARKSSMMRRGGEEEGDEPLSPWTTEETKPRKKRPPPARPPGMGKPGEHPMDRYARDGRRRRLH